ncbi:hypothetical protein BGZ83_011770 [Gryganskiella cystojenkinii]|nr:hypothetical protein BGZ83_011770 [Gryganskiella cystojenkinii]
MAVLHALDLQEIQFTVRSHFHNAKDLLACIRVRKNWTTDFTAPFLRNHDCRLFHNLSNPSSQLGEVPTSDSHRHHQRAFSSHTEFGLWLETTTSGPLPETSGTHSQAEQSHSKVLPLEQSPLTNPGRYPRAHEQLEGFRAVFRTLAQLHHVQYVDLSGDILKKSHGRNTMNRNLALVGIRRTIEAGLDQLSHWSQLREVELTN